LLNGARLIIPQNTLGLISDMRLLTDILKNSNITVLWLTKTLFDQLYLTSSDLFKELRYLIVGGEALNKELVSRLLLSEEKPMNLINGYGPTENSTFSCTFNVTTKDLLKYNTIPIGCALSNRKAYVLNNCLAA
jgi:non-ribosomal peptide synthetase component F